MCGVRDGSSITACISALRASSVFNDIADLLSRGDLDEALRFAIDADLPVLRLVVDPAHRTLDGIPVTWDV